PNATEEINITAEIVNWLPKGLSNLLPPDVQPNLNKLGLAGHSRGGKVAFALSLHKPSTTSLHISALIGIDPVDGMDKGKQTPPPVLTYIPNSFHLDNTAVLVIGSGLGEVQRNRFFPPCAPCGVNHEDFYKECCEPAYYFVAKDYGHLDMLDDDTKGIRGKASYCLCKNGECREPMRRFVGGIVVAFLKAYLEGDERDLLSVRDGHEMLPLELQKVEFKESERIRSQLTKFGFESVLTPIRYTSDPLTGLAHHCTRPRSLVIRGRKKPQTLTRAAAPPAFKPTARLPLLRSYAVIPPPRAAAVRRVTANAGALTNFEVLDLLRSRGAGRDPTRVIASVSPSEFKVYDYLEQTPASKQTREIVHEFVEECKTYDLAKAEILNVINIRPASGVEVFTIIEECESRLDEEKTEELVQTIARVLPPHRVKSDTEIEKDEEETVDGQQAEPVE
ncbi:hypothetical protein RD792_017402, partial [Penstemon davidsonii]